MIRITKEFKFEMAHMLEGHTGKCLNLHGHSYKMRVILTANETQNDMVLDFADLKDIVNKEIIEKADHSFGYNTNSKDTAENEIAQVLKKNNRLIYGFPFRPTAENMATHFYGILKPLFKNCGCALLSVVIFETETCSAEYGEEA